MAIKMTLEDGTVVEGTAEELSELQRLAAEGTTGKEPKEVSEEKVYDKPARVGDIRDVPQTELSTDKRKSKKGDLIRITDKTLDRTMRDMTEGKVYKVVDEVLPHEYFANIIDEKGYVASAIDGGYEVVTHDIDAVKEYFTQGSRVQINIPEYEDTEYSRAGITNDEVGEVIRVREHGFEDVVIVEIDFPSWSCSWNGSPEEIIVVEGVKVGDKVRITDSTCGHDIGTIGEVTYVNRDGSVDVKAVYQGDMMTFVEEHFEVVETEEDDSDELPRDGDIVRVIGGYEGIKRGDIGVVTGADGSDSPKVTVGSEEWFVTVEIICRKEDRIDV